jgi:hypothetical protein
MAVDFVKLAKDALPINDDDWGSDRQIDAENLFFNEVEKVLDAETFAAFENYCLKATTDERVEEALRLLESHKMLKA